MKQWLKNNSSGTFFDLLCYFSAVIEEHIILFYQHLRGRYELFNYNFSLRLETPAKTKRPDPNNQIAAGIGTTVGDISRLK